MSQKRIQRREVLRDMRSAGASSLIIITRGYGQVHGLTDEQEEKFFFPECEKRVPASMVINVEQHCMFHDGFEAMESYFQQVQKTPSLYDGKKVLAMLDKFGQVFCAHLNDEIETLERSKLVAIFPNQKEFLKVWTDMMDWTISTSSKLTTLPWVISLESSWITVRL